MPILSLLETNVGDQRLRKAQKILLAGSCLIHRSDEVLAQFNDRPWVALCLEAVHVDHAGYKLAQMIQYSKIEEITVLTVDGSPHCVQAHFLAEDIKRHFVPELEVRHFVLEKGILEEVSAKAVKVARHLSQVEKIIQNQ